MLTFDLRKPMLTASRVHESDQHPLEALRRLADRAMGVFMIYNVDELNISYTVMAFDPGTGKYVTTEAPSPTRAYELAQAEYQRDTGPSRSVQ
ncbi:hypothetical protein ACOJCM_14725 [Billgrantia sp. LNSP4103-1]|uniref:hypothetical protein n=1 Tax=Billgrantia sp. LNSP4103-1 TaxID=3410266 RepID=UPI00403F0CD7